VKGISKEKSTETISLEDVVDVKGWKALGNRLSQNKIIKLRSLEEPEEQSANNDDDDQKSFTKKSIESKVSLSVKKKEDTNQSSLFEERPQTKSRQNQEVKAKAKTPNQKQKQKGQVDLFGESEDNKPGKSFGVGETIEFDL
jgi:topoisomerase-4 subunit A